MAVVVKIKPVKVTAKSKSEILNKISGYSVWARGDYFRSNGRFLSKGQERQSDAGVARLYSLEKHNRKVKVTKRTITRGKRKGEVEVTREVVRQSGWVAHYYDVPVNMIDRDGTRQNGRNFTLKLK